MTEAFKFLRTGRVSPFAGGAWPEPGTWLDGGEHGIYAILPEALAVWPAEELWRVELDGAEVFAPGIVVAPRGRLVARVASWGDEVAREFARACAVDAGEGASGRAAEYAADAVEAADRATAGSTAALVGYIAAHAAEAKVPGSFAAERRRQSLWLAGRLGLA